MKKRHYIEKRNHPVTTLLDDQMFAALSRACERAGRSKSTMIQEAINRAIPEWAEEQGAVDEELLIKIASSRVARGEGDGEISIVKDGETITIHGLRPSDFKFDKKEV